MIEKWDLAEWVERRTANAGFASVLGSLFPASSYLVESKGAADYVRSFEYSAADLDHGPALFFTPKIRDPGGKQSEFGSGMTEHPRSFFPRA